MCEVDQDLDLVSSVKSGPQPADSHPRYSISTSYELESGSEQVEGAVGRAPPE